MYFTLLNGTFNIVKTVNFLSLKNYFITIKNPNLSFVITVTFLTIAISCLFTVKRESSLGIHRGLVPGSPWIPNSVPYIKWHSSSI